MKSSLSLFAGMYNEPTPFIKSDRRSRSKIFEARERVNGFEGKRIEKEPRSVKTIAICFGVIVDTPSSV